jgi:serine/threonine-protein kinase HipA
MADTPAIRAEAEVRLWGGTVGALVELDSGRIVFEYDPEFRRRGLEISPFHLPTDLDGPQTFDELRRKPAFEGLPGAFADALPDAFGRRVIRAYYEARGRGAEALSPVQRLLYVGERALGALTFHPATEFPTRAAERESLEVQRLAEDARNIVRGEPTVAIPEIYRIGSSAGGQRPKAVVHFDPESGAIRSGGTEARRGEIPSLLKFDGVGDGAGVGELGPPQPYNRVEAAYGAMAREAGIDIPPIRVLEVDRYVHLVIPRFDVTAHGGRLHQHTFGGLRHVDYNEPGAASYEEYFRTIQRLGMAYDALGEAFRRTAFNVMAVNQDDHVKNLSFHMSMDGVWSLTPAYDLTFARGEGWTRRHQMRVRDKTEGITRADLVAVATEFGIKRPERMLDRIAGVLADWERYAANYGVPDSSVRAIRRELDQRAEEMAFRLPI